jgi:hypothetical protein
VFQRFFDQRDAFFHALSQWPLDFLLAVAEREHFVGDIHGGKYGDF